MSSAITNAGEALIALKQNQEAALVIDKFIVANVAGVDPAAAVDRTEGMPDAGDIVYEYDIPIEGKGYINPNQVVYSMLLGSDIGDFEFNWIGLYCSAEDTLVAIAYLPSLSKWKTAHPTMGNSLTRNFMLEYSGLQATTQIVVEAATWQIDFTARLKGIDERERLSNLDIYGGACFFEDGFHILDDAGTFKLQPGLAYVEGIRIEQAATTVLAPALPAEVFLDVALQPQGSDRVAVVQVVYADPGDYVDGTNDNHYGQKIAEIAADRTVTDFRPMTVSGPLGGMLATLPDLNTKLSKASNLSDIGDAPTAVANLGLPTANSILKVSDIGAKVIAPDGDGSQLTGIVAVPAWMVQSVLLSTMRRLAEEGMAYFGLSALVIDEFSEATYVDAESTATFNNNWDANSYNFYTNAVAGENLIDLSLATILNSSGGDLENAIDNDTATYWTSNSQNGVFIDFEFDTPIHVSKFGLHTSPYQSNANYGITDLLFYFYDRADNLVEAGSMAVSAINNTDYYSDLIALTPYVSRIRVRGKGLILDITYDHAQSSTSMVRAMKM